MQRYRVNYKLLVTVFVGVVVIGAGMYFLQQWQVSRKASWFRDSAKVALDEGKTQDAFDMLLKYVQLRRDEDEPRIELANIGIKMLEDPKIPLEMKYKAYAFLEETVRRTGNPELRRKFVEMNIASRPQDALMHLEDLIHDNPEDTELLSMQLQALYRVRGHKPALEAGYKLVGYDQVKESFDDANAPAKHRPEVYSMLAGLAMENNQNKGQAQQFIDEMIKQNPDSAEAYLNQAIFFRTINKPEEAKESLEQAYELDPHNIDVLQQKGLVALEDKDFELAAKIFSDALKEHSDRLGIYSMLARVQMQQNELDEALKTLEQGEKQVNDSRALVFTRDKINIYFQRSEFDAVEKEIDKLIKSNNPALQPFIDFSKARIAWQNQHWSEAARQFQDVRPKLIDYPIEQSMAGALLATCYEQQGKFDLAIQTYKEVLEKNPSYEAAKLGLQALQARRGVSSDNDAMDLDKAIEEMSKLPEPSQDWDKIDALVHQIATERNFTEARTKLVQANVLLKRKKFEQAKQFIREAAALEPDNVNISFAAISLLSVDPDAGPEKALALLDKVEQRVGDTLRARATRAQLLRMAQPNDLIEQLDALSTGIESWTPAEQAELFATISAQFEYLRQFDKAREYLLRTVQLLPDSLPARVRLFEIAFQQHDTEKMREAEKLILELMQDEEDGNYIHALVRRMMWEYTQQDILKEELAGARKKLDAAIKRRPQWAELHILYGQLLLVLEEDQDLALQHLEDALKYGPPNVNALALQVKLLGQRGQMQEARKKLDMIPEPMRLPLLGRSTAEVLLATDDKDKAFESAQQVVELEPENATTQVWFARIANEAGKYEAAVKALAKATELQPTDTDIWMQLLAMNATQKDSVAIENTLRRAQLAIEGDFLPLLTAKKFELVGDWQAAEKLYLANLADRLDDLAVAQRMAEFYLVWAQQGKLPVSKAAPYINNMLRQANEGKADRNNPYVAWARDKAARLLTSSGDYQQSLKAQKLLGSEGDLKELPHQEKALLAEILASRNEPRAQLKAIGILSDMDRAGTITKSGALSLARLLSKKGDTERSNELLTNAILKFGNDEQVRATFIDLLIERAEFIAANKQLEDLRKINPKSQNYIALSIKLAAESGNQTKLQSLLKGLLPPNLTGALDAKQLEKILMVTRLATEHEQYDLAAQLYPLYVQRTNQGALEYARFLALHGDPTKAMELLKQLFPKQMDEVLQICTEMLRIRRQELGDKFNADVNALMASALRDDPESVRRMLLEAEILETQGKYKESVAKYENTLKRDDIPRMMSAAAKNNLGFLLTLLNQRTDEAERLINEALEIYGPVDDILDTRAVVHMARKDYEAAVEDMSLATSMSNDPVKFYHFAKANLLAGNDQAAIKAWEKAQKLGFTKEKLPLLEQPDFDQVKSNIEGLRTQNAQL